MRRQYELADAKGECHVTRHFCAPGVQFCTKVIGAIVSSSTVLMRKRPSSDTSSPQARVAAGAHAAGPDGGVDFVGAEPCAGGKGHGSLAARSVARDYI